MPCAACNSFCAQLRAGGGVGHGGPSPDRRTGNPQHRLTFRPLPTPLVVGHRRGGGGLRPTITRPRLGKSAHCPAHPRALLGLYLATGSPLCPPPAGQPRDTVVHCGSRRGCGGGALWSAIAWRCRPYRSWLPRCGCHRRSAYRRPDCLKLVATAPGCTYARTQLRGALWLRRATVPRGGHGLAGVRQRRGTALGNVGANYCGSCRNNCPAVHLSSWVTEPIIAGDDHCRALGGLWFRLRSFR